MAKEMTKKMVTLTIEEPKNCRECPVANIGLYITYCAGRGRTLIRIDDPLGPRPEGCPLQAGSP